MATAVIKVNYIKNSGTLSAAYIHNNRTDIRYAPNANHKKTYLNKELVDKTERKNYLDMFLAKKKYLEEIGIKNPLRKNGIHCIEIVTSLAGYKENDNIDIDAWAKENLEFLRKQFEIKDKKYGDNIISCVLHMDEQSPHIHTMILPIDEKGKFCGTRFIDRKKGLYELHEKYVEEMTKKFELKRGREWGKTPVKRDTIQEYYQNIEKALDMSDVPKHQEFENIEEYEERVQTYVKGLESKNLKEKNEMLAMYREMEAEKKDLEYAQRHREELYNKELERVKNEYKRNDKDKEMMRKVRNFERILSLYGDGSEHTLLSKLERQECAIIQDIKKGTDLAQRTQDALYYCEKELGKNNELFYISDYEFANDANSGTYQMQKEHNITR